MTTCSRRSQSEPNCRRRDDDNALWTTTSTGLAVPVLSTGVLTVDADVLIVPDENCDDDDIDGYARHCPVESESKAGDLLDMMQQTA